MSIYDIRWETSVEADSPYEAAQIARKTQLKPESVATVFEVRGPDRKSVSIDTDDDPPEETYAKTLHVPASALTNTNGALNIYAGDGALLATVPLPP